MTATLVNPWIAILTGQTLGAYRLVQDLGAGNFGVVFEATHDVSGAGYAVKVLTPTSDAGAVLDFDNEGVLLKRLSVCPGVINFVETGVHSLEVHGPGGTPVPIDIRFHVMAQADGSLDELILDPVNRSSLGWDERIRIWRSMVKGLMQMHNHGVTHRDLKCSNCLLVVSGNETKIRFGDLGRARDTNLPASRVPEEYLVGRGDLRFAPPEALFWQGGAAKEDFLAADYYGLGSLLVELVTGQPLTSLTIGDFAAALALGREDYVRGLQRDLSTLDQRYRNVIAEVVEQLPRSVRADAEVVLNSLCRPEPSDRLAESPYRRDRESREKLAWILRRADIMIRRLEIEIRDEMRREKVSA